MSDQWQPTLGGAASARSAAWRSVHPTAEVRPAGSRSASVPCQATSRWKESTLMS
ncbi:hypothetical protein [Streptomyces sp. RKAG290]|uniref:hypothetical protein n=1 Tax=Streptomyces sp. RKAG290 TaxID=2888348 RepID=UPI00203450C8|nr:hypothetical protein [Streptomyces sp. RKAG290]MCM2411707.1 hypothetical protein [Streptomyces sp. RKAG290]